ncbi:acyltransferase [Prevotella sp. E13-27]|nr:acyltransferase [Prevotella sp. E13-27]
MLMIVAHHFILSGFVADNGPLVNKPLSANSVFLWIFGAWGKTGINCFMMITGYFMCTSKITLRKLLKLLAQVYFYRLIFFALFLSIGYETLSTMRLVKILMPFWGVEYGFTPCFIVFFLTIPFWTILVQNMTKRQHELLLILMLGCYTLLGSVPTFTVSFNYVTWFGIIFLIASYIRLYPTRIFERKALWGWLTLTLIIVSMLSVVILQKYLGANYFFMSDTNKVLAVAVAVSSFLWFKNIDIKYSRVINAFGAGTFGVLLIHANSDAMRTWLWKDTINAVGHYSLDFGHLVLFSVGVVLAVFIICNLIDQLRIATVEKWFFNWYDNKVSMKAEALVNKIIMKQ